MPKTSKKTTISKAKKKAWDAFSKYIRLRDCLKTTGTPDEGICVTCPSRTSFKYANAGHFVPDRSRYLLFDEQGVHLQCVQCNIYKKGNWVPYERFMLETYGPEVTEQIKQNKYQSGTWSIPELEEIEEVYKCKFQELTATI